MKPVARRRAPQTVVLIARLVGHLGWPGVVGMCLMFAALATLALAAQHRRSEREVLAAQIGAADAQSNTLASRGERQGSDIRLPPTSDIPLLLTRIQRAAVQAGLGWPRADYQFNAASDDAPASIDVQCALKGSYPNLRRFVTSLLQDSPTLNLREFRLSRSNANASEVDAKIAIVVFLAGESAVSAPVQR